MVRQATIAAQLPQQVYGELGEHFDIVYHRISLTPNFVSFAGCPIKQLFLNSFTLTEVLRLHFLASGAKGSDRNDRFRFQQRGGYQATDDAGLDFKRREGAILKTLSESNIFDLNPGDKVKVLSALTQQLMTYVACRDVIEENFETIRTTRAELRHHQWSEIRREKDEAAFWLVLRRVTSL